MFLDRSRSHIIKLPFHVFGQMLVWIPYYRTAISCFWMDIDPTLPHFHFMFFCKILIPYSRFSIICRTDLQDCSAPAFSETPKESDFRNFEISKKNGWEGNQVFLKSFGVSWCLQRENELVLGVRGTSRNPIIMKMVGGRDSPIMKLKSS